MAAKASHGPLIAVLVGTATIVVAACGGVVFLLARGVSGIQRVAEVRRSMRAGYLEAHPDQVRLRALARG